jgi:hypothetical protein
VDESQEPPESARKSTPIRKHWLDYIDVSARVLLSVAAIWWAVTNAHEQKTRSDKQFDIQIKQQNVLLQSQREISEAQLATSLLTWFKCEGGPQRLMAQQILGSVSPKQAFLVNRVLGKCSTGPKDRETAEKYSLQNSLDKLTQDSLQQLNLARQYRSVGLQKRAAEEYETAYNELPQSFHKESDTAIAARAREAMQDGEYARASDLFEQLFQKIEGP